MALDFIGEFDQPNCRRLPVGYRFDPTDDVLVCFYLKKKVYNLTLPYHAILDFDVFQTEPWLLPGDLNAFKDRRYYFFDIRQREFDNMDIRAAGNGEWRTIEKNIELDLPSNFFVGKKNTLVFWKKQGNQHIMTRWMMHEFRLTTVIHPTKISAVGAYRIFKRKVEKPLRNNIIRPVVIDFTMEDASACPPPPPISP